MKKKQKGGEKENKRGRCSRGRSKRGRRRRRKQEEVDLSAPWR
jgi:hypothetical protein